jgi:hypothetical protein
MTFKNEIKGLKNDKNPLQTIFSSMASSCSTVVEQLTQDPKFRGFNPAVIDAYPL